MPRSGYFEVAEISPEGPSPRSRGSMRSSLNALPALPWPFTAMSVFFVMVSMAPEKSRTPDRSAAYCSFWTSSALMRTFLPSFAAASPASATDFVTRKAPYPMAVAMPAVHFAALQAVLAYSFALAVTPDHQALPLAMRSAAAL